MKIKLYSFHKVVPVSVCDSLMPKYIKLMFHFLQTLYDNLCPSAYNYMYLDQGYRIQRENISLRSLKTFRELQFNIFSFNEKGMIYRTQAKLFEKMNVNKKNISFQSSETHDHFCISWLTVDQLIKLFCFLSTIYHWRAFFLGMETNKSAIFYHAQELSWLKGIFFTKVWRNQWE